MGTTKPDSWLLLALQLPPSAASARVRIWRRLQALGAVAAGTALHALPARDGCREDFEWLAREVREAGGDAVLVEGTLRGGLDDATLRERFREARAAEYRALLPEIRRAGGLARGKAGGLESGAAARLRRAFEAIVARDHFESPAQQEAARLLAEMERGAARTGGGRDMGSRVAIGDFRGRTWVTRARVGVDRIASAWLVRRYVDAHARFRFVRGERAKLRAGEVAFDMFDAEFTHDGGRCTFEVLRDRFALAGKGLRRIGEIVHDIDLKDERYARPETAGVAAVIAGICRAAKDGDRLERGAALFDDLLAQLDGSR